MAQDDKFVTVIEGPAWETHCKNCGAEYKNIQHPMKPLGVCMMRTCECKAITEQVGNGTFITRMVPPERKI